MQKISYEKGIGVIASIVIVAVIAFGGYGVYKISTQQKAEVSSEDMITEEEKEVIAEVRNDVVETLGNVKAGLVLSAQASVDSAVKSLNELTVRVDQAVLEVQGEARDEILALKAEVEALKTKLKRRGGGGSSSGADTNTTNESTDVNVETEIDAIIEDVQADIEADAEAEAGTEDEEVSEDNSTETEEDVESNEEEDVTGEVEVEAEVEVNSN